MTVERVSRRNVYENRWMTVYDDEVRNADGSPGIYGVVDKPDFALIVPRIDDEFVLVEQFRYAVGERFVEFPQGSWEDRPDVDPEELAAAELAEETGYRAGTLRRLGRVHQAYGYATQACHVFEATDLVHGDHAREPSESGMRTIRASEPELRDMIHDGRMTDACSIAAFGLLALD